MCHDKILQIPVLLLTILGCHEAIIQQYSPELETELRESLFYRYKVMQRPQQRVVVRAAFNLLSLNYLDIKEQQLSVTAYFHFAWEDRRLMWIQNNTYDNIRFLFSTEKMVWRPALIVENSVDNIDVISKPSIPFRIRSNGRIDWLPADIFTTHCESYITYWPLDTQTCDIIISSWGYTGFEVELIFDDRGKGIVMSFYQVGHECALEPYKAVQREIVGPRGNVEAIVEDVKVSHNAQPKSHNICTTDVKTLPVVDNKSEHGEWELLNKSHTSVVTEREDESFSRLIFSFTFRRRPLFHMLNTLFPVVLMSFLTVAIFKLSPESGERVGLALTILLAYAVYLTLISESIPQTSMSASLLSSYLASTLFLQTLAVLLTVIYLDMYFTPEEKPVPRWLQVFAQCCLARITCVDCCKRRKKEVEPTDDSHEEFHNYDTAKTPPSPKSTNIKESQKKSEAWAVDMNDDCTTEYTWKDIALMFDRITMYIYFVLVTCLTVVIMSIMLNHYLTAYTNNASNDMVS